MIHSTKMEHTSPDNADKQLSLHQQGDKPQGIFLSLGDSIGIGGVLVTVILWAVVPGATEKALAVLAGTIGFVYLAYKSHWSRKSGIVRHLAALIFLCFGAFLAWRQYNSIDEVACNSIPYPEVPSEGVPMPNLGTGQIPTLPFRWVAIGQSPVENFSTYCHLFIVKYPRTKRDMAASDARVKQMFIEDISQMEIPAPGSQEIEPGGHRVDTCYASGRLTQEDFIDLASSHKTLLYVYARAWYGTPPVYRDKCFALEARMDLLGNNIIERWYPCPAK